MNKRFVSIFVVLVAMTVFVLPPAAASAAMPWWQVQTGTLPTNLWQPTDNIQEVTTTMASTEFGEGVLQKMEVGGEFIGCLGSETFLGEFGCEVFYGSPAIRTAAELKAKLEAAYGGDVEVSGGPVGVAPLLVTVPDRGVPAIEFDNDAEPRFGTAQAKVLSEGGSGRLVITLSNLGDAPIDGTTTPVTIIDRLPEGVEASSAESFAGPLTNAGPVDCIVEASDLVSCVYEGVLPSYAAIEVEVSVSLTGDPPVAGAPGKVTVTGGNASSLTAIQSIHVSPDKASFGLEGFSVKSEEEGGAPNTRAGSHPFQLTTSFQLKSGGLVRLPPGEEPLDERARPYTVDQPGLPRNLRFPLPAGLIGSVRDIPQCSMKQFFALFELINSCPDDSAVGVVAATVSEANTLGLTRLSVPIFNLPPGAGEPARLGFTAGGVTAVIDISVDPENQYRVIAEIRNITQVAPLLSSTAVLWGTPGDPRHDSARGWNCVYTIVNFGPCERPTNLGETAFLRQPVSCFTPFVFSAEIEPWNSPPGSIVERAEIDNGKMEACNQVPFNPIIGATPTNESAGGPSGLDLHLDMPNAGLFDKDAISEGQAKKVEVTLPEEMTVNPSQAEALGACGPAQYSQERFDSAPGGGCPESSKIGSVDITTPLLKEEAHGSVYVAEPYDNPFDSLLALYMVAKIPERGILVKQAGKVELDPKTGQIVTTFDDLPQIPFESFDLHFFEGNRAPLVVPSSCGSYDVVAKFTPWHASDLNNPQPNEIVVRSSNFTVDRGPGGGPCPSGTPPFKPGFVAGTENNAAGRYSPFTARLTRNDGEQEFTRFSIKLPKGMIGKLAGIPFCSDTAIAAARGRTGPDGGQEELDSPSCPAASQIGRISVGAGVGPALTYAPGKIYLAGPYGGAKLSIVAITTATVGPFDLGTVVIRQALKVDPETAEVTTDGLSSDPIPHILQGIVTHARDIRVYVDRENFVLNPTSCERMNAAATVFGSGLDFASLADDPAVNVTAPFQAADCASLGLKPKLSLRLKGGTKRGTTPALRAVLTARKGDANIGKAQVTLPHSAFLEQAHIRTICTRVQFAAGGGNGEKCPKASIYGRAKALTPLLDEPLVGPVYLRSSNNPLPDLVAALGSSKVDVNLVGRIDSIGVGRIRTTFAAVPDAPVSKFILNMQGGSKGLIVNSTNLCKGKHRATAFFKGQNGRRHLAKPLVKARCGKKNGKGKRR